MKKERKNVKENGFNYKKSLGQNFLSDEKLLADIAEKAGVDKNTVVLEIGCGAGALTKELAKRAKKVIGYEIDTRLIETLGKIEKENPNVKIYIKDIMKESMENIERNAGEEYLLVANLPYYITTPLIMRFIEDSKKMKGMSVMVQKEVANRLAASAGSPDYGAITVAVNLRGSAKIIERVGREKFTPVPNVDSAVVKIDIEKNKFEGADFFAVRNAVRCGFSGRRKTLVNNIINQYKTDRKTAEKILSDCGLDALVRGERLTAGEYIALSEALKENGYEKENNPRNVE